MSEKEIFKVWVEIEKIGDETKGEYENVSQYELGKFETQEQAENFVAALPATELFNVCATLTSYVTDLLYRLDNQVCLDDVEELQQARQALGRYDKELHR